MRPNKPAWKDFPKRSELVDTANAVNAMWLARVGQKAKTSPHKRSRVASVSIANDLFAAWAYATRLKTRSQQLVRARPTVDPTNKPRARSTNATRPRTRSPATQRSI